MKGKQKNLEGSNLSFLQHVKNYFRFDSYQAIFKKEIVGGITTFLAMCYILAVNPALVGDAPITPGNAAAGTAAQYSGGLFLATAISSFLATMFMGLWARIPVALAPGMGLNAFFAYTVAQDVGFESALSVTILSGILYLVFALTPLRSKITEAIPTNFKIAIGASIGLFIAYIGLQNGGIVTKGEALATGLGDFTQPLVILCLCLILLGLVLHFAKVPCAMIITMGIGAVILIILNVTHVVEPVNVGFIAGKVNSHNIHNFDIADLAGQNYLADNYGLLTNYSDFSSFGYVAKAGWVGFANVEMWKNPMTYVGVLSFLYMDFFDTTGSLITIDRMVDFGKADPKWMARANQVDAISTIVGAGIGATTVTTFVESTTGVGAGGKTGFSALVTSLLFGLSIALWPILQVFMPMNILVDAGANSMIVSYQPVTSVALVVIGAVMLSQIRNFEWEIFADIPMLFITMIMMVLSNSIAHGLSFGMIMFVLINTSLGLMQKIKNRKKVVNDLTLPITDTQVDVKTREFNYLKRVNWTCVIIAVISVIYLVIETWKNVWF